MGLGRRRIWAAEGAMGVGGLWRRGLPRRGLPRRGLPRRAAAGRLQRRAVEGGGHIIPPSGYAPPPGDPTPTGPVQARQGFPGGVGEPGVGSPGSGALVGAPGIGAPGIGAPGIGVPGVGAPWTGGTRDWRRYTPEAGRTRLGRGAWALGGGGALGQGGGGEGDDLGGVR